MTNSKRHNIDDKLKEGEFIEVLVEHRADKSAWSPRPQVHANESARETRIRQMLPANDDRLILALDPATGRLGALELFPEDPQLDFCGANSARSAAAATASQRGELHARRMQEAHAWTQAASQGIESGRIKGLEDLLATVPGNVGSEMALSFLADNLKSETIVLQSQQGRIVSGGKKLPVDSLSTKKAHRIWAEVRAADRDGAPNGTVAIKIDQSRVTSPETPGILRTGSRMNAILKTLDDAHSMTTLLRASACGVLAELDVRVELNLRAMRKHVLISKIVNASFIEQSEVAALQDRLLHVP